MTQEIYVISGGPSTGKTETIKELKGQGKNVLFEAAREVAETDKRFIGKSIKEINRLDFQDAIFDFQLKQIKELKENKLVFSDRGFGDTLAYYGVCNLKFTNDKLEIAKKFRYKEIFILDYLDFYEQDNLRTETKKEQEELQEAMIKMYKNLGYNPIIVPCMTIKERVDFILSKIDK